MARWDETWGPGLAGDSSDDRLDPVQDEPRTPWGEFSEAEIWRSRIAALKAIKEAGDEMAIMARSSGGENFEPAPQGPHAAVCCDVADLGIVEGQFGAKHCVRVYWLLAEKMTDGRPFMIGQRYTLSLHPKANLTRDLESWFGREIPENIKRAGFDLELLVGQGAFLSVVHNERDGRSFANVGSIMPLPPAMTKPEIPADFERWSVREPELAAAAQATLQPSPAGPTAPHPPEAPQPQSDLLTFPTPVVDDEVPF